MKRRSSRRSYAHKNKTRRFLYLRRGAGWWNGLLDVRAKVMSNRQIEAARNYHEVTKHSYTSVRSAAHVLDWENKPLPYKIYPEAGTIALPRDLHLSAMPALAAIQSKREPEGRLDLDSLTRILFCAGGLTRRSEVGGEEYHFRAAASAGALYPIEMYAAASDVPSLEAGLYHFSPADLKLRGLRRGDWRVAIAKACAMRPALLNARAIIVLTAMFWRSAWKYRARAYRYCFWDAGTILANLLAAANAEGVRAEIVTAFVDSDIELLLGIDPAREGATCVVALGSTPKAYEEPVLPPPLALRTIELSRDELVYDDIVKIHRESRLDDLQEVRAIADAILPEAASPFLGQTFQFNRPDTTDSLGLGETILRRGSTRVFAQESIAVVELATILDACAAPFSADLPRMVDSYLIVNAVESLPAGAYHYRAEDRSLELLNEGEFRAQAGYLCLEQALGRDCSALLVFMAAVEAPIAILGNRGYRDAHLEAGLMGGRVYLAAYSLGRGASGLTFYDDDTTRFFGPHAIGKSPLLMVAIGVPKARSVCE